MAVAVSATGAAAVAVFALVTGTAGGGSSPVVGGSPSARDTTPAPEPTEGGTAQAPAACVDRDIDPQFCVSSPTGPMASSKAGTRTCAWLPVFPAPPPSSTRRDLSRDHP